MGIRIHKDIGYFLHKKNIQAILVPDYDEILDEIYTIDQDFVEKMQSEFDTLTAQFKPIGFTYAQIQLNQLTENKTEIMDFVKSIYNYDDFKGVMFRTPELAKNSHFDDLIDYYENVEKPNYKIRLLKQSLYPDNYYICVKVPPLNQNSIEVYAKENRAKSVLEVGDLVSNDTLHYLMIYEGISNNHNPVKTWAYPESGEEKYFHPYINVLTYIAAKVAGILKPGVSYVHFSQQLEPAIVTHWG